jgi:hypothetical protein
MAKEATHLVIPERVGEQGDRRETSELAAERVQTIILAVQELGAEVTSQGVLGIGVRVERGEIADKIAQLPGVSQLILNIELER